MLYFDPMNELYGYNAAWVNASQYTHKQCNDCDNGCLHDVGYPDMVCDTCNGTREVEISEEEHRLDEECRREFPNE